MDKRCCCNDDIAESSRPTGKGQESSPNYGERILEYLGSDLLQILTMKERHTRLNGPIANSCDQRCVSICFQDKAIGELFADLLNSRGVKSLLIDSPINAPQSTRIVTEPIYFSALNSAQTKQCLVVGPKRTLSGIAARCLEQPLTESAVEEALDYLASPLETFAGEPSEA